MHFDGGVSMRSLVEKSRLEVVGSCNVVVFWLITFENLPRALVSSYDLMKAD